MNESALQTLHLLRDHPWSTASQVARLANLPLRSVQRYLSSLLSADLAQAVSVPQVRGRLYAPSADGIALLAVGRRKAKTYARAFRLDCLHLAETLLRTAALMRGDGGAGAVMERLPRQRRGSHCFRRTSPRWTTSGGSRSGCPTAPYSHAQRKAAGLGVRRVR
jgi:DNA-binding IclR family transcriptional regulator